MQVFRKNRRKGGRSRKRTSPERSRKRGERKEKRRARRKRSGATQKGKVGDKRKKKKFSKVGKIQSDENKPLLVPHRKNVDGGVCQEMEMKRPRAKNEKAKNPEKRRSKKTKPRGEIRGGGCRGGELKPMLWRRKIPQQAKQLGNPTLRTTKKGSYLKFDKKCVPGKRTRGAKKGVGWSFSKSVRQKICQGAKAFQLGGGGSGGFEGKKNSQRGGQIGG